MNAMRPLSATELERIIDRRDVCLTVYTETGPRATIDDTVHAASLVMRREHDDAIHTAVLDRLREISGEVRTRVPGGAAIFATTADVHRVPLQSLAIDAGNLPWVRSADRFFLAPLLVDLGARVPVMVLALSQNSVRLVDASAEPPQVVAVPGLPEGLRDFDALDLTNDRQTLAHLRTSEEPTVRERQYVRAIDEALADILDPESLLVVAAAEPLAGLFLELSRHERLARPGVAGNADEHTPDELARAATTALARERAAVQERDITRLTEFPDRELVVGDPEVLLAAGRLGAIETLFVDLDRPDDTEHVETLARAAHACGARIVAAPATSLPGHGAAAAILRYPVAAEQPEAG